MPIQPISFNPLSWEQASAPLEAGKMGQDLAQGTLNSVYGPQLMQQELLKNQLANAVSQQTLPYAGQQAKAQLGLTQAQAAMNQAMVPYAGYKAMGPLYGSLAAIQNAQNNSDKTLLDFAKTPQGQSLLSDPKNADLQNAIVSAFQRQAKTAQGGFLNNLPMQLPGQSPNMNMGPGNSSGNAISMNQLPGLAQFNASMPNSNGQNTTSVQQASQDAYAKSMFPGIKGQQINRALSADAILNQIDPLMNSVAKFAGLAGKANQTVSKYAQAAGIGPTDPDYSNFQTVKNVKMPIAAGEIGQALGFRATDSQKKMLADIANPDYWDKSPQQALKEYQGLRQALQGVEQQITKTPGQALSSLREEAKKTLNQFGTSGNAASITIPKFKSKEEGVQWFNSLPPEQRHAVRQQLGG